MSSNRFNRWSFKNNKRPDRSNGDQYYYITDFNQVSDKDCINYDKLNDKIYLDNLKLFNDLTKKIKNSAIQMIEQPKPPMRPSNYERLFIWRQRHVKLSVEDQTVSILYLLSKNIPIKLPNSFDDDGIEPYEAIIEAENLAKELREDKKRVVLDYVNGLKLNKQKYMQKKIQEKNNLVILRKKKTEQTENEQIENENSSCLNGELKCKKPEHHSLDDKVSHFSKMNIAKSNTLYPNIEINNKGPVDQVPTKEKQFVEQPIEQQSVEQPVNMNFNLNVDNGVSAHLPRMNRHTRASMYLPQFDNYQNQNHPNYINNYPNNLNQVNSGCPSGCPSAPPPNYNQNM